MTKQLRYGIEIRTERQHHGRECVPGRVKSKTLGDSSVRMTQVYAKIINQKKDEAVNLVNGLFD
jgi:hypothetical protein